MATRSVIAKKTSGGYKAIYCHLDGYPEHNGVILNKYYRDPKKVSKLINLGHISLLDKEIGKKHDFDNPHPGWTIAYHRDRGDDWKYNKPKKFKSLKKLENYARKVDAEYLYIFEDGKWNVKEIIKW